MTDYSNEVAEKIARAVLYEGYLLYPYQSSALKNRKRFQFGVLPPRGSSEARKTDASPPYIQTSCLVTHCEVSVSFDVRVRFLQAVTTAVGQVLNASESAGPESSCIVEALKCDGQIFHTGDDVVERELALHGLTMSNLLAAPHRTEFCLPGFDKVERLQTPLGRIAGTGTRTGQPIDVAIEVWATVAADDLFQLTVKILNSTPLIETDDDKTLRCSLISTHTILHVKGGEFVSLTDPGEEFRNAAAECCNVGTWPVLIGGEGRRDAMLSAPIILYDYPQIAPESPGDLFDATEMDEMLTLRILTLTEEEKSHMDQSNHSREILARTEALSAQQTQSLHGTIRGLRVIQKDIST